MRLIIAGSRGISSDDIIEKAVKESGVVPSVIISGGARGVDKAGESYAERHGIPIEVFPADWEKHGKSAGYIRNMEMADYATSLIAIWDGKSRGTKHMIDIATKNNLDVYVHRTDYE